VNAPSTGHHRDGESGLWPSHGVLANCWSEWTPDPHRNDALIRPHVVDWTGVGWQGVEPQVVPSPM